MSTRITHIAILPLGAWGHTKAGCAIACKLARTRATRVSLLVVDYLHEKASGEINGRFIAGQEDEIKSMIRVIGVTANELSADISVIKHGAADIFKRFMSGQPVPVRPNNEVLFPDIGPPGLLLLDNFFQDILVELRAVTSGRIPIFALTSLVAVAALFAYGPEELGGNGDLAKKIEPFKDLEKEKWEEVVNKMYKRINNEIVHLPGLPPMHDYEHYPQKMVFGENGGDFVQISIFCHRFFQQCDGVVLNSTPSLEGPAIDAWRSWFKDRPVICPGPFDFPLSGQEYVRSENSSEALTFLDQALERYGPKSVVYVSFGSLWWSTEPEKVWAALDVLIERKIPFMFAHASPFASVPDEIVDKIKNCGFGYESSWIPQTNVLRHEACGWFVSHCGQNSVMESLCAGVPIIGWPYEADQPSNAAYISSTYDLGYELYEIRSGYGLLPIARLGNRVPAGTFDSIQAEFGDVLTKAFSQDGERKRQNVLKLRSKFLEGWKEGGTSWKEIDRIIRIAQMSQLQAP